MDEESYYEVLPYKKVLQCLVATIGGRFSHVFLYERGQTLSKYGSGTQHTFLLLSSVRPFRIYSGTQGTSIVGPRLTITWLIEKELRNVRLGSFNPLSLDRSLFVEFDQEWDSRNGHPCSDRTTDDWRQGSPVVIGRWDEQGSRILKEVVLVGSESRKSTVYETLSGYRPYFANISLCSVLTKEVLRVPVIVVSVGARDRPTGTSGSRTTLWRPAYQPWCVSVLLWGRDRSVVSLSRRNVQETTLSPNVLVLF